MRRGTDHQQELNKGISLEESSKKAETELEVNLKKAEAEVKEGSSKRAGEELEQESIKKQKVDEDKETSELQSLIEVILNEEEVAIDPIPLGSGVGVNTAYPRRENTLAEHDEACEGDLPCRSFLPLSSDPSRENTLLDRDEDGDLLVMCCVFSFSLSALTVA
ncbi:hypothetical protein Tco_0017949 [Tanacetum coccineum]